jgi:hypothetical protein
MRWFYRILLSAGCSLLVVSAVLYVVLDFTAAAEQAVAPGAKSFGVAVLGMLYLPPILLTAFGGLLCLLLGWSVLTVHRFRTPLNEGNEN